MTFAPVLTWGLRQQRAAAELRRQLNISRAAHTAALMAVARQERTITVLSQRLQQVKRDCELLALSAKDRDAALAFLRTAHDIDKQQEAS